MHSKTTGLERLLGYTDSLQHFRECVTNISLARNRLLVDLMLHRYRNLQTMAVVSPGNQIRSTPRANMHGAFCVVRAAPAVSAWIAGSASVGMALKRPSGLGLDVTSSTVVRSCLQFARAHHRNLFCGRSSGGGLRTFSGFGRPDRCAGGRRRCAGAGLDHRGVGDLGRQGRGGLVAREAVGFGEEILDRGGGRRSTVPSVGRRTEWVGLSRGLLWTYGPGCRATTTLPLARPESR